MRLAMMLLSFALLIPAPQAFAQDRDDRRRRPSHASLDLTIDGFGISIGNSRGVDGLRLNFRDDDLEWVNGINFTIWKPRRNYDAEINGIALGIYGPQAGWINGIAVGVGAVEVDRHMAGLGVGGLAFVSGGSVQGIALGGLASVVHRDIEGIGIGGLATVVNGDVRGIGVGGLAFVAEGQIEGIGIGGLASVTERSLRGISFGGLASVVNGRAEGLVVGGLASVVGRDMTGLTVGGLAVVSDRLQGIGIGGLAVVAPNGIDGVALSGGAVHSLDHVSGIAVGGYLVESDHLEGLIIAGIRTRVYRSMTGVTIAGYNRIQGTQRGLAIGLYNRAHTLHGVQIGLLNYAGNNKAPFKWLLILPFVLRMLRQFFPEKKFLYPHPFRQGANPELLFQSIGDLPEQGQDIPEERDLLVDGIPGADGFCFFTQEEVEQRCRPVHFMLKRLFALFPKITVRILG